MTHPLDPLVDSILIQAASDGRLADLPEAESLLSIVRGSDPPEGGVIDALSQGDRARKTAVLMRDGLSRAQHDLDLYADPDSLKVKATEIADLKLRLAGELQAMREGRP